MSIEPNLKNRLKAARLAQGWSQEELARASGLSRSGVSAIETERLVPSAAAALALAKAMACRVEDLFQLDDAEVTTTWAWQPADAPCRHWEAEIAGRRLLYPGDAVGEALLAHDGFFEGAIPSPVPREIAERTLVLACCDPAVGLLAAELAQRQVRLLVLSRSSRLALQLLQQGLVHVAGVHLSRSGEEGNSVAVKETLGSGFRLLRVARWQEGLAVAPGQRVTSIRSAVDSRLRWVGRETGSGARQCLDEILGDRKAPRHEARSHRGVAEVIRSGLADAGVCLRLVSQQAGLDFISIREEAYDLCFASGAEQDPRIRALIEVVESARFRKLFGELPGYSTPDTGTLRSVK